MHFLQKWFFYGVLPGLVVAALLAVGAMSLGIFESWIKRAALEAFPQGSLFLISKSSKNCPENWELVGEVSILGWDPVHRESNLGRSNSTLSLDDFGERRDADRWGYDFDYFRFLACGKP